MKKNVQIALREVIRLGIPNTDVSTVFYQTSLARAAACAVTGRIPFISSRFAHTYLCHCIFSNVGT